MPHEDHEDWFWFHSQLMPLHNRFRTVSGEMHERSRTTGSLHCKTGIDAQEAGSIPLSGQAVQSSCAGGRISALSRENVLSRREQGCLH